MKTKWLIFLFVFLFLTTACLKKVQRVGYTDEPEGPVLIESCQVYGPNFEWDSPNDYLDPPDYDLDGYRIYRGENESDLGSFDIVSEINDPLIEKKVIADFDKKLNPCVKNYLYVTSIFTAASGKPETKPSNVVCWGSPCPPGSHE